MGKKKRNSPLPLLLITCLSHVVGSKLKILFSDGREAERCHVAEET